MKNLRRLRILLFKLTGAKQGQVEFLLEKARLNLALIDNLPDQKHKYAFEVASALHTLLEFNVPWKKLFFITSSEHYQTIDHYLSLNESSKVVLMQKDERFLGTFRLSTIILFMAVVILAIKFAMTAFPYLAER